MSNNAKLVRSQLRQIAKELLPEILTQALYAEIGKEVTARLNEIQANIKENLERIDQRSKDVQSYIVRATAPIPPANPIQQEPATDTKQ